jgi:hypothetical protein
MNKRSFLKSVAALGGSALLPSSLNPLAMYKTASAAVNYAGANVVAPSVMPQVINIFLYGGPSELSGNLSNIQDIEDNSQNSYAAAFGNRILTFDDTGNADNGFITKNGFWRGTPNGNNSHLDDNGAGGRAMQYMLDNKHMSVYRTLFKELDGTRSHRESLLQSFKGSLDIEGSPGVGTRIAATLYQHRTQFENNTVLADGTAIGDIVNDLLLPFVSFEGDTRAYQQDPDFVIPLLYRGITLDQNFNNPYTRGTNSNDAALEDLLLQTGVKISADEYNTLHYSGAANSFNLRAFLESKINNITTANNAELPLVTEQQDADALGIPINTPLVYPNNQYTNRIRAAVTLALVNPSSLYITVGGGLGGWDDHNNGIDNYRNRMNSLFEVMKAAMLHIKYFNSNTLNLLPRTTNDNIVINMCGDFGRRVNLNGNQGWDHGNNQNLFTFGGAAVRKGGVTPETAALGKVVGRTVRVGESGTNNQVTEPAPGSYKAEPMSVAATVYSYFGVQNPEVLTRDDELNPDGVPAIDETQTGEPAEPGIPSPSVT